MKDIAHKAIVLKLNRNFFPVGVELVSKSICDLMTGVVKAIDIVYSSNEEGVFDLDTVEYINPVTWNEWISLPVRNIDLCIHSTKITIRVPTVVVTTNYSKIHFRRFKGKPTKEGLFIRDGGTCAYTGKELEYQKSTIDHIIPLSRGGNDTYDNAVLTSKEINNRKGNRLNSEAGLTLLIDPHNPNPIPVSSTIRKARNHDWKYFLISPNK